PGPARLAKPARPARSPLPTRRLYSTQHRASRWRAEMRLALAQINGTVGDLRGNTRKIIEYLERARGEGANLVAFPELAITGYPPEDLLLKPDFIRENLACLEEIARASRDLIAIVGFVDRAEDLYNAAAVLYDGRLAG